MSHAAHFLTRLERLAAPEVDLALALYRDPRIVKELISTVCVSSSDRAALALTADPQGPHLIVGGDGGFITCLARGMGLNGTRRIERREVQAALKNKALVSLGDELLQEHPALLTMLSKQAVISREEFSVIAKFQPALEHLVVDQLIKDVEKTFSLRERWEEDRLSLKGLEAYWRAVQKHGHLASLLGMSGRRFDGLDRGGVAKVCNSVQTEAFTHGAMSTCARALWASARWGWPRIEALRNARGEAPSATLAIGRLFEVAVLGLSHPTFFDEARTWLGLDAGCTPARARIAQVQKALLAMFDAPLAALQSLEDEGQRLMRAYAVRSDSRFEALQFAILQPANLWEPDSRALTRLAQALPFIAHCKAEELYLPDAVLEMSGLRQISFGAIEASLTAVCAQNTDEHPLARQPRLGRNEPCGCGSGKKHKRCCLATV